MSTIYSRRTFLSNSSLVIAGSALRPLMAQSSPDVVGAMRAAGATVRIETQPLRGSIYALLGSGGNILVLSTPRGKLLVDAGLATSRPQIEAAISALEGGPLNALINTHWHFDHTDGNGWLHTAGAEITAHANTRKRLSTTQHMAAFNATFPPSPAGALPHTVFDTEKTIRYGDNTVSMGHYKPAHTDSDISVFFESQDILHTGDTWFNGLYPFIDYSSGGSITGMIEAADRNVARVSETTIIVPGHGPVGKKTELIRYTDMLKDVTAKVSAGKKQGKSLAAIVDEKPTANHDANFSAAAVPVPFFVQLVYMGV